MTTEILKAISHLAELAEGTDQFDEAAQAYWENTDAPDRNTNLDAVKEAHDNINNRFILLQDAMGRILREYGQRSGEFGRILQADEQFNYNN